MIIKRDNLYGIADYLGKVTVPIKYEAINDFSEGKAAVKLNRKWRYISKGLQIIPFLYDDAGEFKQGNAQVKKDNKWGLIKDKGEIIVPIIYDYTVGLLLKEYKTHDIYQNGKWGKLDSLGRVLISPTYDKK